MGSTSRCASTGSHVLRIGHALRLGLRPQPRSQECARLQQSAMRCDRGAVARRRPLKRANPQTANSFRKSRRALTVKLRDARLCLEFRIWLVDFKASTD